MQPFGILAVLTSVLLIRQVAVGRAADTAGDLRDILVSVVTGDLDGLGTVLSRHGSDSGADTVASAPESGSTQYGKTPANTSSSSLLNEMVSLGEAAKGYRLGSEGPDYYDCSGLVWKAMKNLGIYTGARFTTANFVQKMGNKVTPTSSPATGDIVVWRNATHGHMGVVGLNGSIYSALSPSNGIGYQSEKDISNSIGLTPSYYQIVG
jgi:cell wall-associated NlpC family hydrolase